MLSARSHGAVSVQLSSCQGMALWVMNPPADGSHILLHHVGPLLRHQHPQTRLQELPRARGVAAVPGSLRWGGCGLLGGRRSVETGCWLPDPLAVPRGSRLHHQ